MLVYLFIFIRIFISTNHLLTQNEGKLLNMLASRLSTQRKVNSNVLLLAPNGEQSCKYEQVIRNAPAMPRKRINKRKKFEKISWNNGRLPHNERYNIAFILRESRTINLFSSHLESNICFQKDLVI